MSEMRWVLLGGVAIVMAMLVAWTMQADTGPMPVARTPVAAAVPAEGVAPDQEAEAAQAAGPARTVGKPVDIRATYGNPLAAKLHRDKMVPVEPPSEEEAPVEPAAPAAK